MSTDPDSSPEPEMIGSYFRKEWQKLGLLDQSAPTQPDLPIQEPNIPALIREQRLVTFREFCPPQFRAKIDRAKIPNLAAWDAADAWSGAHPGIWLWSHETGEAKTRMLWRKFGQFHVEHGKSVCRVSGLNLSEHYHDAYKSNRTSSFYANLTRYDVLMLDDLDKIPLPREAMGFSEKEDSDRNARMIREVFDRLYERLIPVLVTSNEPISWFGLRVGASAERRMREVCAEIKF